MGMGLGLELGLGNQDISGRSLAILNIPVLKMENKTIYHDNVQLTFYKRGSEYTCVSVQIPTNIYITPYIQHTLSHPASYIPSLQASP